VSALIWPWSLPSTVPAALIRGSLPCKSYWADGDFAAQTIGWHQITSAKDAAGFAETVLTTPRRVFGDTDIGNGLDRAIDMLVAKDLCSVRRIVNVSGDGMESHSAKRKFHISLAVARKRAEDSGIVVNALAIRNEVPGLAEYYHDNLITGPGSFVMEVKDFTSFGAAIEKKLTREISLPMTAALDPKLLEGVGP